MSIINSSKTKLMIELKKQFPRMRNVEDIADVLLAGQDLNAIDRAHEQTRYAFMKKGAKSGPFHTSYAGYQLLEKRETDRTVYFIYKRPLAQYPKEDADKLKALKLERRGLYRHMLANPKVRAVIVKALSLSMDTLDAIRKMLEDGDTNSQLRQYGKVIDALVSEKLYDKKYDYFVMGFRNVPHHYWLSKLALKLLSDSK